MANIQHPADEQTSGFQLVWKQIDQEAAPLPQIARYLQHANIQLGNGIQVERGPDGKLTGKMNLTYDPAQVPAIKVEGIIQGLNELGKGNGLKIYEQPESEEARQALITDPKDIVATVYDIKREIGPGREWDQDDSSLAVFLQKVPASRPAVATVPEVAGSLASVQDAQPAATPKAGPVPSVAPEPHFEEALSKLKEASDVLKQQPNEEQEPESQQKHSLFGRALDRLKEAAQVLIRPQEKPDQIVATPGKPGLTPDEAREQFIAAAKIVANVLRENGRGGEATQLEEVSQKLSKSPTLTAADHENIGKSIGSAEEIHQQQAAAIEKLKEASLAFPTGQQPDQTGALAPNAGAGTPGRKKDDGVGLLDITVKSNPITSFTANFGAHYGSQKGGNEQNPKANVNKQTNAPAATGQQDASPVTPTTPAIPATSATPTAAATPATPEPAVTPEAKLPPTAFTKADIQVELLEKMSMTIDKLEHNGQLDKLLRGEKTDLINTFAVRDSSGQSQPFAAKLVLHRDEDGSALLKFDLPKKALEIPKQVMGTELSPEVRQELETTGRGPLLVFKDARGQEVKAYIGVNKEMNKVVLLRQDAIKLPETVKGVVLDKEQREMMSAGKPIKLTGLSNTPGSEPLYNATVQIDAARKGLSIKVDNAQLHVTPASKQDVKPALANTPKQTERVAEDVKPKGPKMRH